MRDLLGDLVVGALVERGLSPLDVIGDGSDRLDALGCTHGDVFSWIVVTWPRSVTAPSIAVTEMCFATTSGSSSSSFTTASRRFASLTVGFIDSLLPTRCMRPARQEIGPRGCRRGRRPAPPSLP